MIKDTKSKRAPGSVTPTAPNDPHSISFVKGLVARGEAARADAKRNLPSGATHEIVGEAENGLPIGVRRRFSHWAPDTMRFKQMDMAEPLIALLAIHHSAKTAVKGKSPLAAKARPIETCVVSAEQK